METIVKTRSWTKTGLTVLALFLLVLGVVGISQLNLKKIVYVSGQSVKVDIAQTDEEMAKGLSGRKSLKSGEGMLFVYPGYFIPSFWMKDMLFAIDIIWIKDNMVIGFEKNVQPPVKGEELAAFQPQSFVNYVLEVPAGFVQEKGVKIGDEVEL